MRALLRVLLPADEAEFLIGDLEEAFARRAGEDGPAARRAYRREAFRTLLERWRPRAVAARRARRARRSGPVGPGGPGGGVEGPIAGWLMDARVGTRALLRRPGYLAVVTATLALGVGAATTVFSVFDTVLLRPLPYPDADRLVMLGMKWPDAYLTYLGREPSPYQLAGVSVPNFRDWQDGSETTELAAATWRGTVVLGDGPARRFSGAEVTEGFFGLLGAQAGLGRLLTPDDYAPAAPEVAVLSHDTWTSAFGGDPGIVGRTLTTTDGPVTVVGVTADGFRGPEAMSLHGIELWRPIDLDRPEWADRTARSLIVMGRMEPGVDIAAARAELGAVGAALADAYPEANRVRDGSAMGVGVNPLLMQTVGPVGSTLGVLLGAVGFLLLIACTNVANLALARGTSRAREMGVRVALGAGRLRLVRQLLTEHAVQGVVGGALGVGVAHAGVALFRGLGPTGLPRLDEVGVDGRVVAFALILSVATGLLFGLLPALQAGRSDAVASFRDGGRAGTEAPGGARLRDALVAAQVALAMVLLLGAGLLASSFLRLRAVDPGFEASGVLTAQVRLGESYGTEEAKGRFFRTLSDRIAAVPGASVSGLALDLPFQDPSWRPLIEVEGGPRDDLDGIDANLVGPGYLEALGVPLLEGRRLTRADAALPVPAVVLVNATTARRRWPAGSALGRRIRLSDEPDGPWLEVVGVVGDVRQAGPAEAPREGLYVPMGLSTWAPFVHVALRTEGDPAALAGPLREALAELDPTLPLLGVRSMSERAGLAVTRPRFYALLMGTFAAAALLLASVGLYGTMAYSVARRRREVGIRMALGAGGGAVAGMVLRQGLTVTAVGLAVGLGAGWGLTRVMRRFLFETTPTDPLTFAVVPATLLVVAAVACWVPARRAARVDPAATLGADTG